LLQGAINLLSPCANVAKDDPRAVAARAALAEHPRPAMREDAAERNLAEAIELWKARQQSCSSEPPADPAIARMLTRLAAQ